MSLEVFDLIGQDSELFDANALRQFQYKLIESLLEQGLKQNAKVLMKLMQKFDIS